MLLDEDEWLPAEERWAPGLDVLMMWVVAMVGDGEGSSERGGGGSGSGGGDGRSGVVDVLVVSRRGLGCSGGVRMGCSEDGEGSGGGLSVRSGGRWSGLTRMRRS